MILKGMAIRQSIENRVKNADNGFTAESQIIEYRKGYSVRQNKVQWERMFPDALEAAFKACPM